MSALHAPDDPDADDAACAARGDTHAFERLYRRHGLRVHALSRRFLGEALADDGMQDVFVQAWQQLGQFRGEARCGRTQYSALSYFRRAARSRDGCLL